MDQPRAGFCSGGRGSTTSVPTKIQSERRLPWCSLFSLDGERLESAEDIGCHNAVDKVIGHALLNDRLPLDDTVLVVSSRAGFEIIQKALMARCRAVIAIGAANYPAHQLAERVACRCTHSSAGMILIIIIAPLPTNDDRWISGLFGSDRCSAQ